MRPDYNRTNWNEWSLANELLSMLIGVGLVLVSTLGEAAKGSPILGYGRSGSTCLLLRVGENCLMIIIIYVLICITVAL